MLLASERGPKVEPRVRIKMLYFPFGESRFWCFDELLDPEEPGPFLPLPVCYKNSPPFSFHAFQSLSIPGLTHTPKMIHHSQNIRESIIKVHWLLLSKNRKRKRKKIGELIMKMKSSTINESKRKLSSKGLCGFLKEQRGRLYIIRRCIVMLLCWHD